MQPGDRITRVASSGKGIRGTIRGVEGRMVHIEFDARPGVTVKYHIATFTIPEILAFRVLTAIEVLAELA